MITTVRRVLTIIGAALLASTSTTVSHAAPQYHTIQFYRTSGSIDCIDQYGEPGGQLPNVGFWQCHGGDNQKWELRRAPDWTHTIVNKQSGYCLLPVRDHYVEAMRCTGRDSVWKIRNLDMDEQRPNAPFAIEAANGQCVQPNWWPTVTTVELFPCDQTVFSDYWYIWEA